MPVFRHPGFPPPFHYAAAGCLLISDYWPPTSVTYFPPLRLSRHTNLPNFLSFYLPFYLLTEDWKSGRSEVWFKNNIYQNSFSLNLTLIWFFHIQHLIVLSSQFPNFLSSYSPILSIPFWPLSVSFAIHFSVLRFNFVIPINRLIHSPSDFEISAINCSEKKIPCSFNFLERSVKDSIRPFRFASTKIPSVTFIFGTTIGPLL